MYILRLSIKSPKDMSEKISEITGSIFFSTKLIRNSFPEYLPVSTKVWKEPAVTFTNLSPSRGSKKQTRGPCVSLLTWETISYNKYAWARLYLYSTYMVKKKSLYKMDLLCQYCFILAKWFWRKRFKICLCIFTIITPCKRAQPFIWTELNSLWPRTLYVFMLFHYYLPLKKVYWSLLNPLHQMMLCAKFGWKGLVVLENMMKMWNVYNGPWLTTDKFWSYKLNWAFSSAWWAKNYIQNKKYRFWVIIQFFQREINSHHRI